MKFINLLVFFFFLNFAFSQDLKINEVMSNNLKILHDEENDNVDWIEIFNPTGNSILLSNYYLSDDNSFPLKWQLPEFSLAANDFVLIYASNKNRISDTNYHTNFKISKAGSYLSLTNSQNMLIEAIQIPALYLDISYGKTLDGNDSWAYFSSPTPDSTNNLSTAYSCLLNSPQIEIESGKFTSSFSTSISHSESGVILKYTLDGSDPISNGIIYTSPVFIENLNYANNFSTIPTNPSFTFPQGTYTDIRADTRGWLPPFGDLENIATLKVQATKNGCISSTVESRTYLINNDDSLAVISIFVDSMDFFSDEYGIYVYGDDSLGNYNLTGIKSERKAKIDYFNQTKNLVFSETVGLKISGHGSRHSAVKNLQMDFREEYGSNFLDSNLFQNSILHKYESLSLRSGGHRPDCLPRDDYSSDLFSKIEIDHSEYEFVNVYLNGEYWGIHAIKERMNEDYISEKYNLDNDDLIILENSHDLSYGNISDETDYYNLIEFAQANDLNIPANYNHIDSLIDIENFTNYLCSEIFVGNADWPNSNIKYWKKRTAINSNAAFGHDGKWRWLLYDIDGGFGGSCNDVFPTFNTLSWVHQTSENFEEYTKLIIGLMNSQQFRTNYINRMSDLLNSSFLPSVTRPKLATVLGKLDTEIDNHINRWRYPSTAITLADRQNEIPNLDKWNFLELRLDSFLVERPYYTRLHMINFWGLTDSAKITLDVNSIVKGEVKINSIQINDDLEGVNSNPYPWDGMYFKNLDIPLKAIPNPGYRFVEWLETGNTESEIIINVNSDTIFTAIFDIDPNYSPDSPLKINEIMAQNTETIKDEFNEFDDWIEIYNPNSHAVNLNGYYLSDDKNHLKKYKISNDFIIPANGFKLFWADDQTGQGINHPNFKLAGHGEFVALTKPNGIHIVDSVSYFSSENDISFGRSFDGNGSWITFIDPTPNTSNQSAEIQEISKSTFTIYPNPTNSDLIYFSKTISGKLLAINGQEIKSFSNVNSVSIPKLENGIYFISEENGSVKKFVVRK